MIDLTALKFHGEKLFQQCQINGFLCCMCTEISKKCMEQVVLDGYSPSHSRLLRVSLVKLKNRYVD